MSEKPKETEDLQSLSSKMQSTSTADMAKNPRRMQTPKQVKTEGCPAESSRNLVPLRVNVPEKIVFVIDTATEITLAPFECKPTGKTTRLMMIKRIIECFVSAKTTINRKHQYALMIMDNDSTQWVCDWSSDNKKFFYTLGKICETPLDEQQNYCDLNKCFEILIEKTNQHAWENDNPLCIYRAILIYSRPHQLQLDQSCFHRLQEQPAFYLDLLYVHESKDEKKSEEIYNQFQKLNIKNNSYIFQVGYCAHLMHTTIGRLLAHPLQRPKLEDTCYDIFPYNFPPNLSTNV